jgi:Tol biopolymer transport system component
VGLLYTDREGAERPDRAYVLEAFEHHGLFELELATGAVRRLTTPPAGGMGDHAVAVADDGAIAFLRSPVFGVDDLHLLEAGGSARRLTFDDRRIHGFDWLPDRRGLVISSNRNGVFGLWRIHLDGSEPTWLSATGGIVDRLSVGADGRRLAFEEWHYEVNIYRLELAAPEKPRLLAHSTRWDYQPALSPDGSLLAFVSDRGGSPELWTANADGSDASPRTSFGGPYVTSPSWSPDGRRIAFDLRAGGHGDLWLLELPDAHPRRLTSSPAQELAPTWSPDGKSLYFASNRGGPWEVWRLDLETGGDAVQVTRGGGFRALPAPNGDLLFNRADSAGLWRQPAAGGAPEQLLDDLDPADRLNWTVAGGSVLYFRRTGSDSPHLARLDLATGERELIAPLENSPSSSGLVATPEGDAVLVARTDRFDSDLMLLELTDRENG